MSNYWKKKLDELYQNENKSSSNTQSKSQNDYWKNKLSELENSNNKKNNDIAPVKTTEETSSKQKSGWFQKGAFEDGYQFGDVVKTIGGSLTDIGENIGAGFVEAGEKLWKGALSFGAMQFEQKNFEAAQNEMIFNSLTGKGKNNADTLKRYQDFNEKVEKETAKIIVKDYWDGQGVAKKIVDPAERLVGLDSEGADSVFAKKSDALAQSAGQLLASQASNLILPGSGLATMGVMTFGGEMENALQNGATWDEASLSATISSVAEVGTELLFGGIDFGHGTLDDLITDKIAKNITRKTARHLLNFAGQTVGEGFEEILAGAVTAVGQQMSYMEEKELKELFSSEDALDSFIGGAVLGGIGSAGKAVKGEIKGIDSVTGLTKNEQKVVDKVVKDRIAEAEKDGKKLTAREKSKIRGEVMEALERGEISTDTIEEVLGGEDYKRYKAETERQDALQKELNELRNTEYGKLTDIQHDRLAELKALSPNTEMLDTLKSSIDNKIRNELSLDSKRLGKNRGSFLVESYNEAERKRHALDFDLNQFEGKQKELLKGIVEKELANNTRYSREFYEYATKVGADKDINVTVTTTEEIFEMVTKRKGQEWVDKHLKGKIPNAYIMDDGTLAINVKSNAGRYALLGHEIGHTMEKADGYADLQKLLFSYAETKEGAEAFANRKAVVESLYADGVGDVDVELTNDLIGEYIYNDSDFIRHLSVENRNLFQKIWDEIKYLYKMATAGSQEARDLARIKKEFEKVYRESGKVQTEAKGEAKLSLSEKSTPSYEELVAKEPLHIVKVTDGIESGSYSDMKKAALSKAESEGWFDSPHQNEDTDSLVFLTKSSFSHAYSNLSSEFGEDTIRCMAHIPEIIKNAVLVSVDAPRDSRKMENKVYTFFGAVEGVNGVEPVKLTVKEFNFETLEAVPQNIREYFEKNGIMEKYDTLYDAKALEVIGIEGIKKETDASGSVGEQGSRAKATSVSDISVADLLNLVKGDAEKYIHKKSEGVNYSLSADTAGSNNIKDTSTGYSRGESYFTMSYEQDGKTVGTLEYGVYEGEPNVKMIEVSPEYRRKGIGTKLLQELQKKYPDAEIDFGMSTPDGTKLLESITYDVTDEAVVAYRQKLKDLQSELNVLQEKLDVLYDTENLTEAQEAEMHKLGDRWTEVYDSIRELENALRGKKATKTFVKTDTKYSLSYANEPVAKGAMSETALVRDIVPTKAVESVAPILEEAKTTAEPSNAALVGMPKRNRGTSYSFDGAYNADGKQYISDGVFVAEFNSVDETLEHNEKFPIKRVQELFDSVSEKQSAEKYSVDFNEVAKINEGESAYISVGGQLFDSKYVEAIMQAVKNPSFSLADYKNGAKVLVVAGENGRAVLMPARAGENITAAYEAKPIQEDIAPYTEPASDPSVAELDAQRAELEGKIMEALQFGDTETFEQLSYEHQALTDRIAQIEEADAAFESERLASLDDSVAPIEQEAPIYDELPDTTKLTKKAVSEIVKPVKEMLGLSNKQTAEVKAAVEKYAATENASVEELHESLIEAIGNTFEEDVPEVKAAQDFLRKNRLKVSDAIKNDIADYNELRKRHFGKIRFANDGLDVDSAYQELTSIFPEFFPSDIANPSDQFMKIVEVSDMARTIETEYEVDNETIAEIADIIINGINGYKQSQTQRLAEAEAMHIPKFVPGEDIAPVAYEAIKPQKPKAENYRLKRVDSSDYQSGNQQTASVLTEEAKIEKKNNRFWSIFKNKVLDKGSVFEDLSLKTKNRELIGKWNFTLSSESRAQRFMKNGSGDVKSLDSIRKEVESTGKTKQFYEYLYHKHNADRMTLAERYDNTPNKAVFGVSVTAEMSQEAVAQLERENPKFKQFAEDVYDYNAYLRKLLVDNGVISQETAKLWSEMYPHYVPIRRVGDTGLNINVPLDSNKTGVNAPIKRATGGNSDILPLFDTMAQRTIQTYKAIAKNNFGVELKNTLKSKAESGSIGVDEIIDSIDSQDELLQKGKNGKNPTFTVFENGKRTTFEITEDMYDALKPVSEAMAYRNKILNTISNVHRGLLTEYNPVFMLTNTAKDIQDVLINSQHAIKTYANLPKAYGQILTKGKWYTEYMDNGGDQNSYFDNDSNTFEKEKSAIRKIVGMPLDVISAANNFFEMAPRLAEYIASRESGRSVEVSMLDAARVTTNFAAGGEVTKFLDGNGATFLNASLQGAMQQARNVREAKANGLKGWVSLATKFAVAGLPALLLNGLLWDDDEEYEELSDYVKQNYYVVAKTESGKFIRIPKGRALSVIQNAMEQVKSAATGDDEVDLKSFLELAISNLAPNNPIESNVLAPIIQVANNKTWYGEDLIPTRLQDLPAAEQFDESTDSISKWLGENLNYSPYKINYLLNQYSGGVGDVVLPMLTPEAESGNNSLLGNAIAPLKDKFTTDSVMNNQNISDFYDKVDELATLAKSSEATEEDILRYKYINSVNSELGELYARKREIQNSRLSDEAKYSAVRGIQEQIVSIAKEGLNGYETVSIDGKYAVVGDREYRLNEDGEWTKISDKQLERQNEVTEKLGISPSEYWDKTEISFMPRTDGEYEYAYENPDKYAVAKVVGDYDSYRTYTSELYDIKADYDSNGKAISGSAKKKKTEYINNLPLDYGQRIILYRSLYDSQKDKNAYNADIVEYLDSREDISWEEMKTILESLDMKVSDDGTIRW